MRSRAFLRLAPALVLVAATTAACGNVNLRKELGLAGAGPDEFTVVKRKPLEIPSDRPATVDALPTPQPGAPSRLDPTPEADAQRALTGAAPAAPTAQSTAEQGLLAKAGAQGADDAIRGQIEADQASRPKKLLDGLLGTEEQKRDALDPAEEARRLAKEAKAGKNPDLEIPEPKDD